MWSRISGAPRLRNNKQYWQKAKRKASKLSGWGPVFWQGLHDLSALTRLEQNSRRSFTAVLVLLPAILPCINCRNHIRNHITSDEFHLRLFSATTRLDYVNYVIDLHNFVTQSKYSATVCKLYVHIDVQCCRKIALNYVQDHGRSRHG